MENKKESNQKILSSILFLIIGLVLMFVIAKVNPLPSLYNFENEKEIDLKNQISEFVEVPEDENPTIAEIIDLELLREGNPQLYSQAEEGDYLIVYNTKVILFRESTNKIVNIFPIEDDFSNLVEE